MHSFCIQSNCLLTNMAIKGWNSHATKLRIFIFATMVQMFGKAVGEAVRGKHWPPLIYETGSFSVLLNHILFTPHFFPSNFYSFPCQCFSSETEFIASYEHDLAPPLWLLNLYDFLGNIFSCSQINVDSYSSNLAGHSYTAELHAAGHTFGQLAKDES